MASGRETQGQAGPASVPHALGWALALTLTFPRSSAQGTVAPWRQAAVSTAWGGACGGTQVWKLLLSPNNRSLVFTLSPPVSRAAAAQPLSTEPPAWQAPPSACELGQSNHHCTVLPSRASPSSPAHEPESPCELLRPSVPSPAEHPGDRLVPDPRSLSPACPAGPGHADALEKLLLRVGHWSP